MVMKKRFNKMLAAGLAALMVVSLTACGGEDKEPTLSSKEEGSQESQPAQKEELVLGTIEISQDLRADVVAFNKSNEKYNITIKEYQENSGMELDTAITNMKNELTSGGLDILAIDRNVDVGLVVEKKLLADLNPFLDNSSVLSRDSFVESVLKGNTYGEVLACIPKGFSIRTVAGKASQVGDEMGWSAQDIMKLSAENFGAELFESATEASMMQMLMYYNQDAFIDWENGICSFDSREFRKMLEFVAGFPEKAEWSTEQEPTPIKLASGKVLLYTGSICTCYDIQIVEAMYNEPVTYIGYPTADGSVGCVMRFDGGYGISDQSQNKDGAWEFIEFCLVNNDRQYLNDFPSMKAALEEEIAYACEVVYETDAKGDIIMDEEGNPLEKSVIRYSYGEDWSFGSHACTEEEIAILRELIDAARPIPAGNREIMMIISEEAEAFYKGQKSLDEVVNTIQNRASMYVAENS